MGRETTAYLVSGTRLSAVVVTVSDSVASGERKDESGPAVEALLRDSFEMSTGVTVPDHETTIAGTLADLVAAGVSLIVTTGGTGLGPRDVTPEATGRVLERQAPGLAELMRSEGLKDTPFAALSRGVCGIAGSSLIVNLPGSVKGATGSLEALFPVLNHGLATLQGHTAHDGE